MWKSTVFTVVEKRVRECESEHRFAHSVSVGFTNLVLNRKFGLGLDEDDLYQMGLLHDICREWTDKKLYGWAEEHHVSLTPEERENGCLVHAPVAAALLGEEGWGSDVTTGIRWHTLGSPDMGRMGLVIFVSDYLEPLRTHLTEEDRARLLDHETLEGVALSLLEMQDAYFVRKGRRNARETDRLEAFLRSGGRF